MRASRRSRHRDARGSVVVVTPADVVVMERRVVGRLASEGLGLGVSPVETVGLRRRTDQPFAVVLREHSYQVRCRGSIAIENVAFFGVLSPILPQTKPREKSRRSSSSSAAITTLLMPDSDL